MTYKLNPKIGKIESAIVLVFPDREKIEFENGVEAADAVFEKKYTISTLKAVENKIEITLVEQEAPFFNWNGEEEVSFF